MGLSKWVLTGRRLKISSPGLQVLASLLSLDWLLFPGLSTNSSPQPGRERTPLPGILPPQTLQGNSSPSPNSDQDPLTVFANPGLYWGYCFAVDQLIYIDLGGTGFWKKGVQQLLCITLHYKQFWSMWNFQRYIIWTTTGRRVCLSPPPFPHIFWSCFKPEAVRKNAVHLQFLTLGKSSSAAVIIRGLEVSPVWKTKLLGARPTNTVP